MKHYQGHCTNSWGVKERHRRSWSYWSVSRVYNFNLTGSYFVFESSGLMMMKNREASSLEWIQNSWSTKASVIPLNQCWRTEQIPTQYNAAVVVSMLKKEIRNFCENYLGISLLNTAYKIYKKINNILNPSGWITFPWRKSRMDSEKEDQKFITLL